MPCSHRTPIVTALAIAALLPGHTLAQGPQVSVEPPDRSVYFPVDRNSELPPVKRQDPTDAPAVRKPVYVAELPAELRPAVPAPARPAATPSRMASHAPSLKGALTARVEGRVGFARRDADGEPREGVTYGIATGFDRRWGRVFAGAYASADLAEGSSASSVTGTTPVPGSGAFPVTTTEIEDGRALELGVRAGLMVTEKWSVYALAGYLDSVTDITVVTTTLMTGPDGEFEMTTVEPVTLHEDGWVAGTGSEVAITDGIYAKAEYRYGRTEQDTPGAEETERHQLVTGLGLRF